MNIKEVKSKSAELYPENFLDNKVVRPLSVYPVWVLLKLGITANQVTIVNLVIGLAGCALLAFGTYHAIIWGAILINLNYLMDRVDGNIARLTNSTSEFGKLLDAFSDILLDTLIPVSVGIGLYFHPAFGIPSIVYLLVGFAFSAFRALRHRITLCSNLVTQKNTLDVVKSKNILLKIGLVIVAIEPILLLGFALANILSCFLFWFTLIAACELLVYVSLVLRQKHCELSKGSKNA